MSKHGRKHPPRAISATLALSLLSSIAAGCSALPNRTQIDSASGLFDKAKLTYRAEFPSVQGTTVQVAAANPGAAQLTSYSPAGQPQASGNCQGTLEIIYPHPGKREGYALVKVTMGSEAKAVSKPTGWRRLFPWPSADRNSGQETYSMDIPRSELDHIVGKLQQTGYFEKGTSSQKAADLATQIDGANVRRSWDRIAELDALLARVYAAGRSALAAETDLWASSIASDQTAGPALSPSGPMAPPVARLPNQGPTLR